MITWLESHLFKCSWLQMTGFDCPGCGFQRSIIALLKGDLMDSFHLFPALFPLIITFLILVLQIKFKWEKGSFVVLVAFIFTNLIMLGNWLYKLIG
ncbi:MAG: DUF2752 domain-containing protein [Algoriphagus sp.]